MKRLVSFLLTVIIITSALPLSVISANASPFSGGDGSEANPYLVATPEALDAVRDHPKAHYRQTADIDMSSFGNWTPIEGFKGVYDGREFEIKGVNIVNSYKVSLATPYGLFATAQGATFKNICLVDLNINIDEKDTAYQAIYEAGLRAEIIVGGICGEAANIVRQDNTISGTPSTTVFENCSVSGSIRVINCARVTVGGIVGSGAKSLTYCNNYADIFIDANQNYSRYDEASVIGAGLSGNGDMFGTTKIEYCTNSGSIEVWSSGSASICGISSGHEESDISYCVNFGSIFCSAQKGLQDLNYNSFHAAGIATNNDVKYCVNYGKIKAYGEKPKYNATYLGAGGITASGKASYCYNISPSIIAAYIDEYNVVEYPNGAGGRITGNSSVGVEFYGDYSYSSNQTTVNEVIIKTTTFENLDYRKEYDPKNGLDIAPEKLLLENSYCDGYDFKDVWIIDPSVGGPVLRDVAFIVDDDIPEIEKIDFAEHKYRADHMLSTTLSDPTFFSIFTTVSHNPAKVIIDAHPKGMHGAATAWDAMSKAIATANEGPSNLMKDEITQSNLIVSYIMQALKYQTQEIVADAVKTAASDVDGFVKLSDFIVNGMEDPGTDFTSHAKSHSEDIKKVLLEQSEKTNSQMKKFLQAKEFAALFNTLAELSKNYTDLYNRINSYAMLYASTEETKAVIDYMYDLCPTSDKETKKALSRVKTIMDAASEELLQDLINKEIVFTTSSSSCAIAADILWESISTALETSFPGVSALCKLANAEMYVVDKFLGVNKSVEQYFKLCTISDLDALAGKVVEKAIDDYKNERTTENAKVLLGAIELKFGFIDESYRESIRYSEVINDEGIIRSAISSLKSLFGTNENELKESLQKGVVVINEVHRTLLTSWIYQLESDYPLIAPLYDEYKNGINRTFAAKQYSIHCPVNVKVFLPSGELIAEVGEDSVFASEDVAVIYYHGEKEIIFFEDGDYILSCEGYDEGDMDIGITEFDSEGNTVRKVNYNNIPVAPSSIHAMSGDEVKTNDGASLPVDYDSARASEKHKVSIENGVISGYLPEIEASAGERIEISAIIPEGYRFVGWHGDAEFEDASSASTYFFMKDGEVSVSAKFKKLDRDEDEDDNKPNEGIPVIIIFVIAGGALITLSGIAILIVMIKERKKNSKKEKGNEADSL